MAEARPVPEESVALPRATDWVQRFFDATGVSPFWLGVAITAGVLAARLVWDNLTGTMRGFVLVEPPFFLANADFSPRPIWQVAGWWTAVVNAALLGLAPTVGAYLRRGARRDLVALRPALDLSRAAFDALLARAASPPARALRLAGIVGLMWGLAVPLLDPNVGGYQGPSSFAEPHFLWVVARNLVWAWLLTRVILTEVVMTRTYASVGESLARVDLLNLRPLAPFAQKGLRSTVLWVVTTSVFSLFWLAPSAGHANVLLVGIVVILVTLAFVLPVRGVHRRIRAVKRAELDAVELEIRIERDALLAPDAAGSPAGARISSLIAWRDLVERTREWPYDASTLLRFALVMSIGLGSWLGGAVVERMLDSFLG